MKPLGNEVSREVWNEASTEVSKKVIDLWVEIENVVYKEINFEISKIEDSIKNDME